MVASLFGENDFENEVFYRKKTSVLWELGTLQVDDVAGQGASAVIKTRCTDYVWECKRDVSMETMVTNITH